MSVTEPGPSSPALSPKIESTAASSAPSAEPKADQASIKSPSSPSASSKGKARALIEDELAEELPEEERHIGRIEDGLDEEEIILLTTLGKARMTGVDKYRGAHTLKKGSKLDCKRDLVNVFDTNAIEVRHIHKGQKVGYVNKHLAGFLAPLIDADEIEIDGIAIEAPKNTVGLKTLDFALRIYGTRSMGRDPRLDFAFATRRDKAAAASRAKKEAEQAEREEKQLKAEIEAYHERQSAANNGSGASGASSSSAGANGSVKDEKKLALQQLMQDSLEVEKGGRASSGDLLSELFKEGARDPATLPDHPCPPGRRDNTMRTDLMPFQRQGLRWMIEMEHPRLPLLEESLPVQLWRKKFDKEGDVFWHNIATDATQREKPVLKRGGVLADEMGLGKTMQTIALICTDDTGEGVLDEKEEADDRYDDMTLIVCPLSVASNWTDQLRHHVGSKRLSWHLYHGEGRELSRKELRKFDVVITTYQTLAGEHLHDSSPRLSVEPDAKKQKLSKPKEGTLQSIKWRRVVLDEGHIIKNPSAKMSLACSALKAERRWILTGTPIINSTRDLGAMMSFLKLCKPLDDPATWQRYVEGVAKIDPVAGGKILRAVVSSTTLRRTKDMTDTQGNMLVRLPDIKFYLHKVKLDPTTRKIYDEVAAELKHIVGSILKKGAASVQFSHVLIFLLRLRQLANDPALCPQSFIDKVQQRQLSAEIEDAVYSGPKVNGGAASKEEETRRLQGVLRGMIEANEDCSICGEVATDPVLARESSLLFCSNCISEHIDAAGKCPLTHRALDYDGLVAPQADATQEEDEAEVLARQALSGVSQDSMGAAKTKQLIAILRASEEGTKSLVFSQWTSHLNCIEAALAEAGVVSCRFDGSMTQQKREQVIASFSSPLKPVDPKEKKRKLKRGEKPPPPQPTVMLISLKAGALGLNLTCANQVFLMDPWWQASIEHQAIDRVYRIGQQKEVRVFQMVAEDTVEERVMEIQKRKEMLISQAFSATKRGEGKERGESRVESRIQDIKDIFGIKA